MLTKLKNDGATSTAGISVKKGNKGRLELFAEKLFDDGFGVTFSDFGNYGRLRWTADFGDLDRVDLMSIRDALTKLIEGHIDNTHIAFEVAEEEVVEAEPASDMDEAFQTAIDATESETTQPTA